MPIKELEDLLKLASDADRTALEQILERNTTLTTRLQSQDLTYRAIIDGEEQANRLLENALKPQTATTTVTPPAAQTQNSFDLNAILAEIDKRVTPLSQRMDKDLSDDRIKAVAKAVALELAPELLGQATKNSDEVYQVRASHAREFNEELDTPKFTEFINSDQNKGKFASLSLAHDAYVQDKRLQKKIDEGVAAKLAESATNTNLPGSTIPSSSHLASMFNANPANKVAAGNGRGEALDKAAAAFRSLQAGRAN